MLILRNQLAQRDALVRKLASVLVAAGATRRPFLRALIAKKEIISINETQQTITWLQNIPVNCLNKKRTHLLHHCLQGHQLSPLSRPGLCIEFLDSVVDDKSICEPALVQLLQMVSKDHGANIL